MTTYKVYSGFDSPHLITISDIKNSAYTAARMATISRVVINYTPSSGASAEVIDSSVHTDAFDWETYASTGSLIFDLGMITLTAGRDLTAELIIYETAYPNGRVQQIDLYISDELGSGTIAPVITEPLTVTNNYDIVSADFNRSSVRIDSETSKTATLPVGTEAMNGKRLTFIKQGSGNAVLAAGSGNTIANDTHTQLTGTSTYATVTVEFVYAELCWVVIDGTGSWSGA